MIQFQGVGKRFGGRHRTAGVVALHDVSLEIPAGSAVGVVGPNGAGKSTLFALLLGFLRPSAGTISIAGLPPRDYTRKHGAGYLPERFSLPPDWSVRDALSALAGLDRVSNPDDRSREALARLGLEEHADKAVSALSRGLLQRLGIAQAVLAERQLMVLDEPTEGLDPIWRLRLRELITELRREQRTLFIASHDLAEIERLVDRVIVLDGGSIRESFEVAHDPATARRYRIELESPVAGAAELPGIHAADERALLVDVADARELTARLAALLALGAIVQSVQPADRVEERVRAALGPESRS
jgi:ABC-2 type transport system ATP-binding protein